MNRDDWTHDFFDRIVVPHTIHNARAFITIEQCEGGDALWNPLNSTEKMDGSTDYNEVPVQNYLNEKMSLDACVKTITAPGHGYELILHRLRNDAPTRRTLLAWAASDWGTDDTTLMFEVLDDIVKRDMYWDYANHTIAGS
jgi:hypothetical protein